MFQKKLLFLLVLLLSLGLLLAGCGGSKADQTKEPEQVENPVAVQEKTTAGEPEEAKSEEPAQKEDAKDEEPEKTEPNKPEPAAPKEEPKKPEAAAPKEEPKKPEAAAPKEEPKKPEPATPSGPPTLKLKHSLDYGSCNSCHAGAAIFNTKPNHTIDANTPDCKACHALKEI